MTSQECPQCGLISPGEALRCGCGYNFPAERSPFQRSAGRKPWVATTLSILWPGLGQLYNGQPLKSVLLYAVPMFVTLLWVQVFHAWPRLWVLAFAPMVIGLWAMYIWEIWDAYDSARKIPKERQLLWFNRWYLYICFLVGVVVLGSVFSAYIRSYHVQAFKIPAGSMEPTLIVADYFLVDKRAYKWAEPHRGDIVVFKYPVDPSKDFIKRVIAVGGDTVRMVGKAVYVNDGLLKEDYAIYEDGGREPRENFGPVKVPKGSVFVLGDNRDKSYDSRFWGFVRKEAIKGRASVIYWSWDSANFGVRWKRLGDLIR